MNIKKNRTHLSWNPIHPHRDWKHLVFVFVALTALVIGWSAYLFLVSGKGETGVPLSIENKNPTAERIKTISSFFSER